MSLRQPSAVLAAALLVRYWPAPHQAAGTQQRRHHRPRLRPAGPIRDRYELLAPDDKQLLLVIATADRGSLHLEARYNYEALDTGSLFAGWTFAGRRQLTYELTPMLGAVFGETQVSRRGSSKPRIWHC